MLLTPSVKSFPTEGAYFCNMKAVASQGAIPLPEANSIERPMNALLELVYTPRSKWNETIRAAFNTALKDR